SPHWNQYIKDWPTKYHLSPQRPDLLRPFEEAFRDRSILEIGCGCGAITRFLGEAGANVTALEGSFRRAKITAARCRDLSNVEVVCDNFQDFVSDKKYDFVVLVGVLEYSSVFVNSESPAHDVLLKSASYMSGDGKIIVAIENKLGMKYWAGAPEDHVGEAFFGIENRYHSKTARTYGRKELASLLSEAGFGEQEFLFSLPDYKLPSIILREAALEPGGPDLKNLIVPATDHPQFKSYYPTFSPERTWQEVIDNGLTAEFANSFLVVASATSVNSLLPADHLGYIYSSNRHPAFRKGNVFVKKHDGVYIERVLINKEYPAPADFLLKQELVTEKYISGKIMFIGFLELITRRGWSVGDIVAWAKPWVDHVKALASDDQMIPGQYLDLTPMNLLVMPDGNTRHFDQEWVAQQTLPLWYVLYRGLYFCFSRPLYFHVPKHGTAVHAFQLINEIIGHFITTKPDLSEGFKKLEHKYLSPVSLTPDYVPVDFRINLWEHNKEAVDARAALHSTKVQLEVAETQLAESRKLNDEVRKINSHQTQEIARLQAEEQRAIALDAENNRLKRDVEWFSNTYEKRGMFGVMKTKFRNFVKRVYLFILNFLVKLGFVQKRYVMKYMLEYTRDNGLGTAMRNVKSSVKEHGIGAVTHARKYALEAMSREASAKAPVPVAIVEEDLYPESQMIEDIEAFAVKPLFSIIMPTYNTKPSLLKMAIESVQKQVYTNWELCIVDDGSKSEETKDYLKNYPSDPRIRLAFQGANGGISAASNEAIKISTGDYLALFDHDDELAPDALYWMVKEINQHPEAEIIYTDECKKNEAGDKSDYFLKPDWSPQLMLNMMYVGHFTVYHKKFLLEKVGMFRSEYDFSQDYDLMLRATEQTTAIRHIPKVLYYWRQTEGSAAVGDKPYARQTNIKALEDAVRRRNIDGEVIELPTANRVKLKLSLKPFVSIIIPTDSYDNLTATIESIAASTSYINYEIVPVTNSKLIGQLDNKYPDLPMNFVRYDKPYNFSDKCNEGAKGCKGEIVLFLNDDVRPLQVDWIENTIEYLELPGIGGVSPKLIYEDDSIQYAGMITGVRNLTGTSFHCYHRDSTAYINFPQLTREVSILSGACLAMRRDLFLEVDGFDAVNAPSAHSDVDLSFKILEKGLRCIYTPYAELRHIGHL
ncbi:MAG: glycosyltransferase, partial [Flavitalea sp.]